MIYFG